MLLKEKEMGVGFQAEKSRRKTGSHVTDCPTSISRVRSKSRAAHTAASGQTGEEEIRRCPREAGKFMKKKDFDKNWGISVAGKKCQVIASKRVASSLSSLSIAKKKGW
jgi:hypothetical protein